MPAPATNLQIQLMASTGVMSGGSPATDTDAVTQWNDQTANAFNGTSTIGARQTFHDSAGVQSVEFGNGSNTNLAFSGSALDVLKNKAGASFYVVAESTSASEQGLLSFCTNGGLTRILLAINAVSGEFHFGGRRTDGDSSQAVHGGTVPSSGTYFLIEGVVDWANATITLFHNGTQIAQSLSFQTSGNSDNSSSSAAYIGVEADATTGLIGAVKEVLIYDAAHDLTTRQLAESYLNAKYSLWVSGPPATPTNLAKGLVTATTIPLTWTAAAGATEQTIKWSLNSDMSSASSHNMGDGTTAAYTINVPLVEGTHYYITIEASNGAGSSDPSTPLSVWTLPTAPSGFSMTDNHDPVDYAWTRASTHNEGAIIQTATDSGFSVGVVNHDFPDGTITGTTLPLTIGTAIYSRIRNYVDGGATFSAWVNASNNPQTPRDLLVVTASAGSVTETVPGTTWTVSLSGTVTGGVEPYTYLHNCLSRPAGAGVPTYDHQTSLSAVATMDTRGTYVFTLKVTDDDGTEVTGQVTVSVGVSSNNRLGIFIGMGL